MFAFTAKYKQTTLALVFFVKKITFAKN